MSGCKDCTWPAPGHGDVINFDSEMGLFSFEYKLDGDVNRFLIATISEFSAVSNAVVANESGLPR
jgi:hypothetical protein